MHAGAGRPRDWSGPAGQAGPATCATAVPSSRRPAGVLSACRYACATCARQPRPSPQSRTLRRVGARSVQAVGVAGGGGAAQAHAAARQRGRPVSAVSGCGLCRVGSTVRHCAGHSASMGGQARACMRPVASTARSVTAHQLMQARKRGQRQARRVLRARQPQRLQHLRPPRSGFLPYPIPFSPVGSRAVGHRQGRRVSPGGCRL